jgi:transcriptional regulator with GAF, ATPase, and Fis domain
MVPPASGAADALSLPLDEARATARVLARISRWSRIEEVLSSSLVTENLVGRSPAFLSVLRQLIELSCYTCAPVLLLGESGTGKELAARLVHALDPRPHKRDLVVVDCTTIVPELSGSELFGHERGAFTGAAGARDGAFALADGGTLFLDEVGELPPPLQAQLLRVVQEKTFKRVGGNAWHKTDFRLVCATNRDLLGEVARGQFRRDLYYRIAGTVCRMPSLAERNGDVLLLARHFWKGMCPDGSVPSFDDDVRAHLLARAYPGNVRDLRQFVVRMFYRHAGEGPVTVGDVPEDERPEGPATREEWQNGELDDIVRRALALGVGLKEIGRIAEEVAIKIAVREEEGNLQRAATRLGVTDRALQMRRAQRKVLD